MLKLPEVTLFAIDVIHPSLTMEAIEFSCRWVQFAEIIFLTDLNKNPWMRDAKLDWGSVKRKISVIHHTETDIKVPCPRKDHYFLPRDYEMASMREPVLHMKTSHILLIEWDSAVLNPLAWNPSWLDLDYVAAPWPPFHEEGWVPCDGHTNNVGNGGFSLRSQKYCKWTRIMTEQFKDDPALISSDMFPCLNKRPWLEENGVVFAPDYEAMAFSCENRIYAGQFGYHGTWTCERNGWGGEFFSKRYPKPK
jgi:hypothetical protein